VEYLEEIFSKYLGTQQLHILEIGCGKGELALLLQNRGHSLVAIDRSKEGIEFAKNKGVKDARACDVFDFEDSTCFDVVLFTKSLHHIPKMKEVLEVAKKYAKPGGLVIAEEFSREGIDVVTAEWFYGLFSVLEAMNLVDNNPHGHQHEHQHEHHTHEHQHDTHQPHMHDHHTHEQHTHEPHAHEHHTHQPHMHDHHIHEQHTHHHKKEDQKKEEIDKEKPKEEEEDVIKRWKAQHVNTPWGHERLHKGGEMIKGMEEVFGELLEVKKCVYLFRYFCNYLKEKKGTISDLIDRYELVKKVWEWEQKLLRRKAILPMGLYIVAQKSPK